MPNDRITASSEPVVQLQRARALRWLSTVSESPYYWFPALVLSHTTMALVSRCFWRTRYGMTVWSIASILRILNIFTISLGKKAL